MADLDNLTKEQLEELLMLLKPIGRVVDGELTKEVKDNEIKSRKEINTNNP